MIDPARVETEKLPNRQTGQVKNETGNNILTFPGQFHRKAVSAISDNLTKAGHHRSSEQVSAHGEADAVLANIENEGMGAKVTDIRDWLERGAGDLIGDINGSQRVYGTEGRQTGHLTTMNRMAKKIKGTGIAERIRHLLFTGRKAA